MKCLRNDCNVHMQRRSVKNAIVHSAKVTFVLVEMITVYDANLHPTVNSEGRQVPT